MKNIHTKTSNTNTQTHNLSSRLSAKYDVLTKKWKDIKGIGSLKCFYK